MDWNTSNTNHYRSSCRSGGNPSLTIDAPYWATVDSGLAAVDYCVSPPASYTPGYAYPLIVWFHDDSGDERDVLEWLPQISPQNYLGLGLRGPLPVANGLPGDRRWSLGDEHLSWLEDQLAVALVEAVEEWSIHTDRIVVAGIGTGASVALQMLLRQPELFAGAACLNAQLPAQSRLAAWERYAGRNLWLGHSSLLERAGRRPAIQFQSLLHAAGLNAQTRHFDDDEWPLELLGRELDWWLMQTLCAETMIG